ncbi:uncharacterized protein L969DRAFT_86723 [Mixia osmundae IAM 14324]|nr:uncharacterized protein L969DRAFT_86723 [Mixia osmundae IAM 14324]KEI40094.1 hypothetical protein L969DRAFT_86723 [Mixia osmundae IAM 14324]
MFFLKNLTHTINLHPSYFGANTSDYVKHKLFEDVSGTCSGLHGYIVAVLVVGSGEGPFKPQGTIQPGTGMAEFEVPYLAVVFRPFKGEVLDGVVTTVNKMGFFVEVGALTVFVSAHLMPGDMKFSEDSPPRFSRMGDDSMAIQKDVVVRVKIVGTRIDATEIFAIGTIKEDYLGPLAADRQ